MLMHYHLTAQLAGVAWFENSPGGEADKFVKEINGFTHAGRAQAAMNSVADPLQLASLTAQQDYV